MNDYVIPLYALRARKKGYEVSAMKVAMDAVGLVGGAVRPPLVPGQARGGRGDPGDDVPLDRLSL